MSSVETLTTAGRERKRELLTRLLAEKGIKRQRTRTILPREGSIDLPLSFAQERFWFLNELEGGTHYNDHLALRLTGALNREALERSFDEITKRHEVLRTIFSRADGRPVQEIVPFTPHPICTVDLLDLPEIEREPEALRQAAEQVRLRFALDRGPLFRTRLWVLGEDDHLLLLTVHQIVNDGWSFSILVRELAAFYEAFSTGASPSLPQLPIQYADFALWQRQHLQDEGLGPQLLYWTKQLSGALPVLDLPGDRPRPARRTFRGAREYLSIPRGLVDELKSRCREEGATLFMALLTTFKVLLHRYSGRDDLVIGFPMAHRGLPEIEGLMGLFINPLALRTDISGDPTFRELLGRVRETALGAYANQDLPFEKLVAAMRRQRDVDQPPLFQVLFDYNNVPTPRLRLPGLSVQRLDIDGGTAKFDLSLELSETPEEIQGFLEYNTDLFNVESIKRMAGHFRNLLEAVVSDPDRQLSKLSMLSRQELHQLLVEWNNTGRDYVGDQCIHEKFEAQVAQTPDSAAVRFAGRELTYSELNSRANQLAHYLINRGIGPGALVGICIERSLDMVIGLLAVLKTGGAYVPLDPGYPRKRLDFMLKDADVSLLLTQAHLHIELPGTELRRVCLDADLAAIAKESGRNPLTRIDAQSAAYVIYTSGSTGTPKGVIGTHRGVMNRLHWMNETYPFEASEVCCQKTSLSFVDSVAESFGPLLEGVLNVLIRDEAVKDPRQLIEDLGAAHVTRIVVVPSLLRAMLDSCDNLAERLPKLKYWITSGEVLSPELCNRFHEGMPGRILINLYGSSEVSADSTCYQVTRNKLSSVPIGRPISNTQIYLVDRYFSPVPVGVPGELVVGGAGVAHGYLKRAELSAERFISNPFDDDPESRLYRTGDLARYLPDGNLEYLGRLDRQVKLRGFRIELREIEAALGQHPGVSDALVVAKANPQLGESLVAYVATASNQRPELSELREFVKQRLPEYMVPTSFVLMDCLPLTPNGKVDHQALPDPEVTGPDSETDYELPTDELERQLVRIWERILRVRPIRVTDNFFNVGGHSLLAVRVLSEIERVFGKYFPLATILRTPTIRQLAGVLRENVEETRWSPLVPLQPQGSRPPLYCIHAAGGNVLFYRDLAKHLGPEQPLYGLQARGMEGNQTNHDRVEDMALYYLEEIRRFQPEGPYYLGGASFGGLVAFEMARRLEHEGETVALLALFDTYGPKYQKRRHNPSALLRMAKGWIGRARGARETLTSLEARERVKHVLTSARKISRKLLRKTSWKWNEVAIAFNSAAGRALPRDIQRNHKAIQRALRDYRPQCYGGRLTLFRAATQALGALPDHTLGWDGMAQGGLDVKEVPGFHEAMTVDPFARVLAEKLTPCLIEAQQRHQ